MTTWMARGDDVMFGTVSRTGALPKMDTVANIAVTRPESTEEIVHRLDAEFDQMLANMKPFVLRLNHKSDRQRCAVWIKKFCEPPATGITGRKNRNMYAQLLTHMMKRGILEGPFNSKPEAGPLPTLLSYMSNLEGHKNHEEVGNIPPWVMGELSSEMTNLSSGSSLSLLPLPNDHLIEPSPAAGGNHARGMTFSLDRLDGNRDKNPDNKPLSLTNKHTEPQDSWSNGLMSTFSSSRVSDSSTLKDESSLIKIHERELGMKTKMLETKFQEEKLKLQQKHDSTVQKILDRKNAELEELKGHYRSKYKEQEEAIGKMEKRVQSLQQESSHTAKMKEEQIEELKRVSEETSLVRQAEYEKKVHDAVSQVEQEKFDIQKQHTANIQSLLDDTNQRLQKMEDEYCTQAKNTGEVVKELEGRIQQITKEAEASNVLRQQLELDKQGLQGRVDSLQEDLHQEQARYLLLEQEQKRQKEEHIQEVHAVRSKLESDLQFNQQEYNIAALKIKALNAELEQKDQENLKKLKKLESIIKEKDSEIGHLLKQNKHQMIQSEHALLEFKSQVESNSAKIFSDMKQQMEKVEQDLNRSKQLREKQTKEYEEHIEDQQTAHEQRLVELRLSFDGERSALLQEFQTEKSTLKAQREQQLSDLRQCLQEDLKKHQQQAHNQHTKDAKAISGLEAQINDLEEQLHQSNQLRKQQLLELGLLREEERQKMQAEFEAQIHKWKSESEQKRLGEEKKHSTELEDMLQKTNDRLKEIECEYAQRSMKSTEAISELQRTMQKMTEDHQRSLDQIRNRNRQQVMQLEDEKKRVKQQHALSYMGIQEEVEKLKSTIRQQERKKEQDVQDHEEQMCALRMSYEQRMSGLMPISAKQELENTISSLRSQINSLQQRYLFNTNNDNINSSNNSTVKASSSCTIPVASTITTGTDHTVADQTRGSITIGGSGSTKGSDLASILSSNKLFSQQQRHLSVESSEGFPERISMLRHSPTHSLDSLPSTLQSVG